MALKTAISDTLKIYSIYLLWCQAKEVINNTPDSELVHNIYNHCLEAEKVDTTFQYMMAMQELEAMATPSSSKDEGEEEQPVSKLSQQQSRRSHKTPEGCYHLVDKFAEDICGFNPCAHQEAYQNFIHNLAQLLSKLDSTYFTNMNNQVVFDTILDKDCKVFLECPEETVDKVQQRTSSDNIPTGPDVINKMQLDEDVRTFNKAGQQAVTHLFGHLQDTHNHMSQVAAAVVELSKVSSPEQLHLY